jgi:hypothetical protein
MLTGIQSLEAPASNSSDFLFRDTLFLSTHLNMPLGTKFSFLLLEKLTFSGSIPFYN